MNNMHDRVLIIGAGLAGNRVLRTLISDYNQGRVAVGYVDDDENKIGLSINGLPVLGNRVDIPDLIEEYQVNEVIIAMPSAHPVEIMKIIEICKKTRVKVNILPGIYNLGTGKIITSPIREVELEDLLGREPLTLDTDEITGYLNDQVVLITGAGGSVGTELARHVANSRPRMLVLMGHGENSIYEVEHKLKPDYASLNITGEIADIKDRGRISRVFKKYKPAVVFHAAAHKHVPYMERIPEEAVKNNIIGTKVLCDVAIETGCKKFLLISTDKAVQPTSIMGLTKRVAELVLLMMNGNSQTKFVSVRFGNILGSRGSVIPLFEKQISMGGPVTITHPQMMRYFMTVNEAAQLVIQAGAMAGGGEIFVLDMGEPICINDLATKLIRLKGLEPGKDIVLTYTGIRPGEKISEKLVGKGEELKPTLHKKIYEVYKPSQNFKPIRRLLTILDNNFSYEEEEIRTILREFQVN